MTYTQVKFEQQGRVGIITLNRPERLNAWTDQMMSEMKDAVARCNEDESVGSIVFTGAGRAYCAGADVTGWADAIAKGEKRQGSATRGEDNWIAFMARHQKPTIAALNGAAVGVGVTHVLPMDIRIASDQARIGMFFVRMGLVPELASSHYLAQMVGTARALEWCLTARMIDASEAREAGLVSEVVPAGQLLTRAVELGETLAGQPLQAVSKVRELFRQNALERDLKTVMAREGEALTALRETEDHKEAVRAFIEKRQPHFTGR